MNLALMQWITEALLLVAICVALPAALRLERALAGLRRDRGQLAESAKGFAEATREADAATARLRSAADGAGRGVAEQARMAGLLREDLRMLCDRAERIADRLDGTLRSARVAVEPASGASLAAEAPLRAAATVQPAEAPVPRARAEAELLEALRRGRRS
jgi:hypothetical protein